MTTPGNQGGAQTTSPQQQSTLSIPTLPDVVGQVPGAGEATGRLGLPQIPGMTQ